MIEYNYDDVTLVNGDCLEYMKNIPDDSVNMVLCDLPYGTTAKTWDSIIPIEELWGEYNRIVTKNGIVCLFGSEPFSTKLRISNIKNYKYDLIWKKNTSAGFIHAKNRPLKTHENISVFSKGSMGHKSLLGDKRMTYNPQGLIPVNKTWELKKWNSNVIGERPSQIGSIIHTEWTNYPGSVLDYKKDKGRDITSVSKPIALCEYLIRTFSNDGDLILDNTMGGGSTGIAAVRASRRFLGIEIDADIYAMAKKRIIDAINEMRKLI